jgi:hypothetical protein
VQDDVTIWYRGANYQLGRGRHGYAIWPVAGQPEYPLEQWPETPQGWAAAWSRFNAIEHPAAIVHLSRPAAASPGSSIGAAGLLAGVACGIAGLFPAYLSGASLASDPANLVPHVIYLATWLASGLLIVTGGTWRQVGALLGLGTSIVVFGYFLADLGTALSGGTSPVSSGLAFGLISWLLCTAGAAAAAWPPGLAGTPRWQLARRGRPAVTLAVTTLLAAGVAVAFAPSWDSYTLQTPSHLIQTVTAGNIFSNPGPVIAGNVAVMVALVVAAAAAALWQPARLGAALLAGALIPMAAQAISALIQASQGVSPAQFGISPGRAAQVGLTITSGLTPAFWIYLALVIALAGMCAWMLVPARSKRQGGASVATAPAAVPWQAR